MLISKNLDVKILNDFQDFYTNFGVTGDAKFGISGLIKTDSQICLLLWIATTCIKSEIQSPVTLLGTP